jgi:hypothetical protein
MAFLFRKYTQVEDADVSQPDDREVETEEQPTGPPSELTFFPPSPKAQIMLIAAGVILFNAILIATVVIVVIMNQS